MPVLKTRVLTPLLTLAAAGMLAGCEPVPPATTTPDQPSDECRASAYQGLVGQPHAVTAQMTFPVGTRVIGPDEAVTADFRPDRLNIEYGRSGRIDKVSCF